LIFVAETATAAAFVGTTVHQVSLWRSVSSDEGSSGCRNVNKNSEYKGCILMNFLTY